MVKFPNKNSIRRTSIAYLLFWVLPIVLNDMQLHFRGLFEIGQSRVRKHREQ